MPISIIKFRKRRIFFEAFLQKKKNNCNWSFPFFFYARISNCHGKYRAYQNCNLSKRKIGKRMNITPWTMWKEVSKRRIDAFYFDESFKAQTWHTVGTTFLRHTMIFAYVEWKQCLTKRNGRKVDDNLASGTKRFRVDIKRGSYSINNNPFSPWIAKIKDNPEETNQIEANWATLNNTLWSNWPIQPGWKSILLEKFLLVSKYQREIVRGKSQNLIWYWSSFSMDIKKRKDSEN